MSGDPFRSVGRKRRSAWLERECPRQRALERERAKIAG
jgi:hypothetical protein